ncbi:MAG TPA: DUF3297 domain-containing protein [Methylophilaceae bacterium]|nr:DUF3297 domain-containing protein [Methylophilaceae bacterium]
MVRTCRYFGVPKSHIHRADDGLGHNRKIFLNGNEVDNVLMACESGGWVRVLTSPMVLGKNGDPLTVKLRGRVKVKFTGKGSSHG